MQYLNQHQTSAVSNLGFPIIKVWWMVLWCLNATFSNISVISRLTLTHFIT